MQPDADPLSIETPHPEDAAEIFFVQRQSWHEHYSNEISHEDLEHRFADAPERIENIKTALEDEKNYCFFVVRDEAKMIGFISARKSPHLEIRSLCVLDTYRGRRITTELITRAMNWLGHRDPVVVTTDRFTRDIFLKNAFIFVQENPGAIGDARFELRWDPPTIEIPTPDDAAEIFFVQRQTWHESYLDQVSHEEIEHRFSDAPTRIEQLREKIIESGDHQFFVARYQQKIIAFVSLTRTPHPEIESLYALAEYHGWGLGRKLMEKSLEWLGSNEPIFVETHEDAIQKFYERFGFELIGPVPEREGFSKNMRRLVLKK